jgi:hypothetical protein
MKSNLFIKKLSLIYGLVITFLLGLIIIPKVIEQIITKGNVFFVETLKSFTDWSDPMPFFILYLLGYVVVLWKPLWGSVIIILVSIFYVVIAGVDGPPIFAIPAFLVGLFYLLSWIQSVKNTKNV